MDLIKIKIGSGIVSACVALLLSGCMTIPNSATPRFYLLSSVDENIQVPKIKFPSGLVIGVGPLRIPQYLNRPQIVMMNNDGMIEFAQFDRWGESLEHGLSRLIREDIGVKLSGANLVSYPWNPLTAVKYQVSVEVVRLDDQDNKHMFMVAQWTIIDVQNMKTLMIKESRFRMPVDPKNYSGFARSLSTACVKLSNQIAVALERICVIANPEGVKQSLK